jgi:hypothetical protein
MATLGWSGPRVAWPISGPLELGAGAGQVAKIGQHEAEVAVPGGHVGVVGTGAMDRLRPNI